MKRNTFKYVEIESDQDSEEHYLVTAGHCLVDYGDSLHTAQVVAQYNDKGDFAMVKLKDHSPKPFFYRNQLAMDPTRISITSHFRPSCLLRHWNQSVKCLKLEWRATLLAGFMRGNACSGDYENFSARKFKAV